jgi:DNA-directed RNA polymerase subunit beta'
MMTDPERYKQVVSVWRDASDEISKFTKEQMEKHGNVGLMISSGSRGNISQLNQMVGIRGLSVTASGETIELPAQHGYKEGLTGLEYFISMKGQRKALADIALKTADAGYLTRRLVDVSQNVIITNNGDVNDYDVEKEGTLITEENSKRINKSVAERVYGRFLLKDIVSKNGKVLAQKGQLVDLKTRKILEKEEIKEAWIPSIVKSKTPRGISQIDYGSDFSTHKPVTLGTAVGIIAAQSLGEPSTQLTMRSKHTGGILAKSDITTGLPRVEEIFEARTPKIKAPISPINGVVEKIEGSIDNGFTVTVVCKDSVYRLPFDPSKDKLLLKNGDNVSNSDTVILDSSGQIITAGLSGEIESNDKEVIIKQLTPEVLEFNTEPGMGLLIKKGDRITRGQAISEGPLDLQNLLDIGGIDVLQQYIIEELNEIYLSNGITVNEKHIEVIIRQMCNKVQIIDSGDSDLTPGENISRALAVKLAKQLVDKGMKPVTFKRIITGISRASLSTESFLSAASFQETARVLVEAVVSGRKDNLIGLKENVILGQLIPAGTGFNKDKVSLADVQEEFDEEAQMLESE